MGESSQVWFLFRPWTGRRVGWVPYLETGHQHVRVLWMKVHSRDITLGCAKQSKETQDMVCSLPGDRLPACEGAVDGSPQPWHRSWLCTHTQGMAGFLTWRPATSMCGCCGWKSTAVTPLLAVHTYSGYEGFCKVNTFQHIVESGGLDLNHTGTPVKKWNLAMVIRC